MNYFRHVRHILIAGIVLLTMVSASFASDGLYEAVTDDGITLKMKRYRPKPEASFNEGAQPILLFPGIVCNMNEFLSHTPEERVDDYQDMELPEPLADWAMWDLYIAEDPMRYYSIAYYLWSEGYDPWFANYRGTGRGDFKSDEGDKYTNLDVWAALDAPACIDKVYAVTGIHPVIGGHSTGGLVSYCYLQGIYIDVAEMGNGYIPHVKSSASLAEQRNSEIKGFIGLDPAAIPPFPELVGKMSSVIYPLVSIPVYLDLDNIMENMINPMLKNSGILISVIDLLFGTISGMSDTAADKFPAEMNILTYMNFWQVDNTHPYVEDFFARYGTSSVYFRGLSQYLDFNMQSTIREHWMNGEENKRKRIGPEPAPGEDGYYYYIENMSSVKVPTIVLLSYYDSLVSAQEVIEDVMEAKTKNSNDEYYIVDDSSHVDVPVGLNAPTYSFPKIGAWLKKVLGTGDTPDDEDGSETEDPAAADGATSQGGGGGGGDDDEWYSCFISHTVM